MSWATRRKFIIVSGIIAVGIAFFAVVLISVLYEAPSCNDGVKNQGEEGIDCGGTCPYLCTSAQREPIVLFTKALPNGNGRTDVIALIENGNPNAGAKSVHYTITLYGIGKSFIQEVSGFVDLPPAGTVPVYVPGISSGNNKIIRAFLTIESSNPQWIAMASDPRLKPTVTNMTLVGTTSAPRIDAVLTNATVTTFSNVPTIVFVRSASGDVIAASKTVVTSIPAQGQATATFTWNTAFTDIPATIEVMPVIPLP
jgi:hypothetical protein